MKKLIALATLTFLMLLLVSGKGRDRTKIEAVAVTGANRLLSQPVWDLGPPFGLGGFNFVFGFNPAGPDPLDLDESTPGDTLLATGADPNILAVFGLTLDDIDPDLLNVPFRDVAIIVDPAGGRAQVPSVLDVPGFAPSKSRPNDPITLDQWLEASGSLRIRCRDDGTAIVRVKLKKLIVNGVYTLWGVFVLDLDNDGIDESIVPVPLGGVPNVLIADKQGKASITRTVNFCPLEEPRLKTINIAFHSDGNVYGGVRALPLAGLPGGVVTHDQINFPVNVAGPAN